MKRCLTAVAAAGLGAGAMFASSAYAGNSFAISVGVPGLAVGYSNYGGYVAAAPAYYAPSVVYGPVVTYAPYRPWHPHPYYRPYYRYHPHW